MIITTVHNNTNNVPVVTEAKDGVRKVCEIQPGGHHRFRNNLTATYKEYWFAIPGLHKKFMILTSDDFIDWNEIEIRSPKNDVTKVIWKGLISYRKSTGSQSVSHLAEQDGAFYLAAREDASERIETVARFSLDLEELLKRVIISVAQCKHLVQFCSIRMQKIKEIFSGVSDDQMRRLYESKKLRQLSISLDNLVRALVSTRILLEGCGGKEWRKAALVLSLPPPDNQLEKYSGSRFALLIRELGWSFDMVQYALGDGGTKDLIFEWRDEGGRYVLQGNLLQNGVAIDEMESLQEDNDRVALDRQHLLTYLENSSILKGNAFSPLAWRRFWYTFPRGKFAAAVQNRCQDRCFEIDYLDF